MSASAQPAPPAAPVAPHASGRLEGLDALRGIAALCVLHFHTVWLLYPDPKVTGKGYLAVDFFFMLSGYVMSRTYEHRFALGYGTARFMAARYRRLWPIMAIGALIGAPWVFSQLPGTVPFLTVVIANLLLVPAAVGGVLYPLNVAAWSILAELGANLAHGLFFWRWRTRWILLLAASLIPVLCWTGMTFGDLDVGASPDTIAFGLVRAIFAYCVGIVLWRWWQDRPAIAVNPAIAFAAMPVLVLLSQILPAGSWICDIAFVLLACPLLIAGGLACKSSNGIIRWLGMISFPLYAINHPLLHWAQEFQIGAPLAVATCLALATLIAIRTSPQLPARRAAIAV